MKRQLYPLIALVLLIFSCKDVEEPSPNSQIEGRYVSTVEIEIAAGVKLDLVNTLDFKSDGTFSSENYTTEADDDDILGYRSYYNGTYTIAEGKVTLKWQDYYAMNYFDIYYMPKADLTLADGNEYYSDYAIEENYTQLSFMCPPNAFCTSQEVYVKAN
ncbi:hypothetical protein [Algoriphagus yeomjeoni]|uniref:Lipocalin-like protein n=1 Tax=Algoriphagus yeomjeoni TaxID=291403 RepID=A0A327PIB2_9BACT|nr:hypothetical protein [Algoriphagus yeomjeoni]RAI92040.1 hypothetical protein LV83_01266 [Algoriphagus yeomjeoni]